MSPFSSKPLVVLIVLVVAALLLRGVSARQPAKAPDKGDTKAEPGQDLTKALFYGAIRCEQCHREWKKDVFKDPCCQLSEWTTWARDDKHSLAFTMLKGPLAQQIGTNLGWDLEKQPPHKRHECLRCHAMDFPEDRQGEEFHIEDGVTCDGCHGPAQYWYSDHSQKKLWRGKNAEAKAKLGFLNVRDPVTRGKMCASCHVGNATEGKVVTHVMYAAGHPPLPSFEVATFSAKMPAHWQSFKKKSADIQKLYSYDPEQLEQTKMAMMGSLVTFGEAMRLLGFLARTAGEEEEGHDRWPELSQFDCYACHHELKGPGWRQLRNHATTPGRPPYPAWVSVLVPAAIWLTETDEKTEAAEQKRFREKRTKLQKAYENRPFGNPPLIVSSAQDLAEWTDQLIDKVRNTRVTRPVVERLLSKLAETGATGQLDYDSARQLAWVFQVVHDEYTEDEKPPSGNSARIVDVLAKVGQDLHLELPAGKNNKIMDALPARFEAIRKYDPKPFREQFAEIGKLLSGATKDGR
jgi:hypothetical protein